MVAYSVVWICHALFTSSQDHGLWGFFSCILLSKWICKKPLWPFKQNFLYGQMFLFLLAVLYVECMFIIDKTRSNCFPTRQHQFAFLPACMFRCCTSFPKHGLFILFSFNHFNFLKCLVSHCGLIFSSFAF